MRQQLPPTKTEPPRKAIGRSAHEARTDFNKGEEGDHESEPKIAERRNDVASCIPTGPIHLVYLSIA